MSRYITSSHWTCGLSKSLFALSILFVLNSCTVGRGNLSFSQLKYPVSLSPALYDGNEKVLIKGQELEPVRSFEFKQNYWSLLYGGIPLTNDRALSKKMNDIISQEKGVGIINLSVTVGYGVSNKVSALLLGLPGILPIYPGCSRVIVKGEVVRLSPSVSEVIPPE